MSKNAEFSNHEGNEPNHARESKEASAPKDHLQRLRNLHLDFPKEHSVSKTRAFWRQKIRHLDKEPRTNRLREIYQRSLDDYKWLKETREKEKEEGKSRNIEQFVPAINQLVQRIETLSQRALPSEDSTDHLGRKGRNLTLVELDCIAEYFNMMRKQAEILTRNDDENEAPPKIFKDSPLINDPDSYDPGNQYHSRKSTPNKAIEVSPEDSSSPGKNLTGDTLVEQKEDFWSPRSRAERMFKKAQDEPFTLYLTDQQKKAYETDMRIDEHIINLTQKLTDFQESSSFNKDNFKRLIGLQPQEFLQNLSKYCRDKATNYIGKTIDHTKRYTSSDKENSQEELEKLEKSLLQYNHIFDNYKEYTKNIGQRVIGLAIEDFRVKVENPIRDIPRDYPHYIICMKERNELINNLQNSPNFNERFFQHYLGSKPDDLKEQNTIDIDKLKEQIQKCKNLLKYQGDITSSINKRNELINDLQNSPNFDERAFQYYMGSRSDDLKEQNTIDINKLKEQTRRCEHLRKYLDTTALYIADLTQRTEQLRNAPNFKPEDFQKYAGFDLTEFLNYRPSIEPGIEKGSGLERLKFEEPEEFWHRWYRGQVKNLEDFSIYQDAPNILKQQLTSIQSSLNLDKTSFEQFVGEITAEYISFQKSRTLSTGTSLTSSEWKHLNEISSATFPQNIEKIQDKGWYLIQIDRLKLYQVDDQISSLRERINNLQIPDSEVARFEKVMDITPDDLIIDLKSFSSMAKSKIEIIKSTEGQERNDVFNELKSMQDSIEEYQVLLNLHFPDTQDKSRNISKNLEWWQAIDKQTYKEIFFPQES